MWAWDQMPDRSKLWEERDASLGSWLRNIVRNCGEDTVVEVCLPCLRCVAVQWQQQEGGERRCRSFSSRDVCHETDNMQHHGRLMGDSSYLNHKSIHSFHGDGELTKSRGGAFHQGTGSCFFCLRRGHRKEH